MGQVSPASGLKQGSFGSVVREAKGLKMKFHPSGIFNASLAFAIVTAMAFELSGAAAAEQSVAQQIRAVRDDFEHEHARAVEALRSAKVREEGWKRYRELKPSPARCVERLLRLARIDPKSADGFEALAAAVEFSSIDWNWKDESVRRADVVELLAANHLENPSLGEVFGSLKDLQMPAARDLMRQAARRNPSRDVRAMAVFSLAGDLDVHARLLAIFREVPSFKASFEELNGKGEVAELEKADPQALREEAIALLLQAQSQFGDVKIDGQLIRDQAGPILFRLRRLNIGQVAPEITGTDQDGRAMKLSDYRGKVVALVFWGSWCGMCMREVPAERELVRQMQDKPFVLVGVNSDPGSALKSVIEKNRINWRSWSDGEVEGPRPIARAWNVTVWPKIYLLDEAGVIRYTELAYDTSDGLERAVGALVSRAGGAR